MKRILFISFAFILSACQNDTWNYEPSQTSSINGKLSLEQLREQRDKREKQEQQQISYKIQQRQQKKIEHDLLNKLIESEDYPNKLKQQASETLKKNKSIIESNEKINNESNYSDPYKNKSENLFDF